MEKDQLPDHQYIELSYIYDTIARIQDRRGQVFVFFGTASLTALAIGLQEQKAGFILISILFLLLYMGYEGTARAEMAPFFFRGYAIEKKHKGEISIFCTYLGVVEHHSNVEEEFDEILKIKDFKDQAKRVNKIFYNPFRVKRATTLLVVTAVVFEIALMLSLHFIWSWSYF